MSARALLLATGGVADAAAWAAQVVTNGGTVSAGRLTIVNNFIAAEKAAGTWALTDDYWPLWGENAVQGLTSLKQRRLATVVAAPTFVTDRGYTFDGVANYVNTGFLQSTMQVAMSATNMRIALYQRNDLAVNATPMGNGETATRGLNIRTRTSTNFMSGQANCTSVATTATVANSLGWSASSRSPAPLFTLWRNGVAVTTPVPGSFTASAPSIAQFVGATNNAGTAAQFVAAQIGFACVGASLDATQEAAQYSNVQAWATSIGANV